MKIKLALLLALVASGCSYRVVVEGCDASLEGDGGIVEADAAPPPCESECAYETGTTDLYFVERELNEHDICKSAAPTLCTSGVCDLETGCGPE